MARHTSDFIFDELGNRRDRGWPCPSRRSRTVLWPMSVAKLTAAPACLIAGQRLPDVERRAAAVPRDDCRHAHPDEVLGARLVRQIVGVRVHVDESRRDHEPRRIDHVARRRFPHRSDPTIRPSLDRHVRLPPGGARPIYDPAAADDDVV